MRAGPSLAHLELYWKELYSAREQTQAPGNMHSLKCILAAASWGKVKTNRTATRNHGILVSPRLRGFVSVESSDVTGLKSVILLINTTSSSGEAGGRADRPCEMTRTVERPLASRFGLVVWGGVRLPVIKVSWRLNIADVLPLRRLFPRGPAPIQSGEESPSFWSRGRLSSSRSTEAWDLMPQMFRLSFAGPAAL